MWSTRVFGDPPWLAMENEDGCCYLMFYNHDGEEDVILCCPGDVFDADSLILELDEEHVELSVEGKTPREFITTLLDGLLKIARATPVAISGRVQDILRTKWRFSVGNEAPISLVDRVRMYAHYFGERKQLLEALIEISEMWKGLREHRTALNEALQIMNYIPRDLSEFEYERLAAEDLVKDCLRDARHQPFPDLNPKTNFQTSSTDTSRDQAVVRKLRHISDSFSGVKIDDTGHGFFHEKGNANVLHFSVNAADQWEVHNLITGNKQLLRARGNGTERDELAALVWATASGWLEIMTARPISQNSLSESWAEIWNGTSIYSREDEYPSESEVLSSAAGGIALLLIDSFRAWDFANTNRMASDRSHLFEGLLSFTNMLQVYELRNALIEEFDLQQLGAETQPWFEVTDHFGEVYEMPFEESENLNPKDMFIDFTAYASQFDVEQEGNRNDEFFDPWRAMHEGRVKQFIDSDGVTRAFVEPRDIGNQ